MIKHIGRFLVAGGAAVTVDFAIFIILRWLDVPLAVANAFAFTCAFLVGFTLNRHWTFDAAAGRGRRQLVQYGVVALAGLALNTAVLTVLVGIGVHEIVAKAAATVVSAALNFTLSRTWVFR